MPAQGTVGVKSSLPVVFFMVAVHQQGCSEHHCAPRTSGRPHKMQAGVPTKCCAAEPFCGVSAATLAAGLTCVGTGV